MSEFISTCPKCNQQILCDTAYVGRRIACPVCLQEIQMPEPSQRGGSARGSQVAAAAQEIEKTTGGKGRNTVLMAVIGVVVVILVAAVVILALRKPAAAAGSTATATTSVPVATQTPAVTAAPNSTATPAPALAAQDTPAARVPVIPAGMAGQCRARWTFDQDSGDTVSDITGNGHNGKLVGKTAVWLRAKNADSSGLHMDGSECVEVAAPVVNTAKSFTVACQVKLDVLEAGKCQAILSIDGEFESGFVLEFFPYFSPPGKDGGWLELSRTVSDLKDTTTVRALTKWGVSTNTWYHLAGVYDAELQSIGLYLNGSLQTNVPCARGWQATGKTVIGRGLWNGYASHYLRGAVRDVSLYEGALTPDQIKELAR